MKEVTAMWKYTPMIVLTALSAAIFAATLIVFAGGIVLIPGITNVRPANVFPVVFGLLFGPAGAWGSAIGNLIGDVFSGTLNPGSIAAFVGAFYQSFIAYKLWGVIVTPATTGNPLAINTGTRIFAYVLATVTASVGSAVIIAWFADLVGLVPFAALASIISLNNLLPAIILGPPLLILLAPRIQRWGLLWTDIMQEHDVARGFASGLGAVLMVTGALGGLIVGIGVSTGLYGQALLQFGEGEPGQTGVWLSVLPFLGLIFLSGFMLASRRQFISDPLEPMETNSVVTEKG